MREPLTPPLTLRADPIEQTRDLTVRTFQVRAESLDEATRSVEATIATEDPVTVFDMASWSVIDEVLRMDGAEVPDQVPLLANHNHYQIDSVFGSARGMRITTELVGRLYFADSDADAEKAWNKVRQKHLRDVSAGYRATEYTEIDPGQTAVVKGRSYTAGQRRLRISTRWQLREVSLVPIGADKRSKIRGETTTNQEIPAVNPKMKAFLVSLGLRADSSDKDAQEFYLQLNAADRTRADAAVAATPAVPPADSQRSDPPATPPATPPTPAPAPAAPTPDAIRQEGVALERQRVRAITELAGADVPASVRQQAIEEGWDQARASQEFLIALRGSRGQTQTPPAYGPAIHSRSHEVNCNVRSLGMGLMLREGVDEPVRRLARFIEGAYRPIADAERNSPDMLRAADDAYYYRDMSLVDICREACRIDGTRIPHNRGEMIRTAMSGSALTAIFSTNLYAQLLMGYTDASDTTMGWCSESDVANFQANERGQMGNFGALKKHARGKSADHMGTEDKKESYKIGRYSGKFIVDEMDIIDDRFGAIEQTSPVDMGNSARQLRPNMVYAILLANAALQADNVALFHSTHKNTTTGALAAATLQTAIQLMAKQRKKGRPLNLRPRFLLVPQDLWFAADILLASAERIVSTSDGTKNPLKDLGIELRHDDRMGVAGVTDPDSGAAFAGTATNYFLTARPGEEGAKTIEVGYLRGTGRAPQVRSFVLTQGEWGVGWDVTMDIGAKAIDFPGMVFSTGAP